MECFDDGSAILPSRLQPLVRHAFTDLPQFASEPFASSINVHAFGGQLPQRLFVALLTEAPATLASFSGDAHQFSLDGSGQRIEGPQAPLLRSAGARH